MAAVPQDSEPSAALPALAVVERFMLVDFRTLVFGGVVIRVTGQLIGSIMDLQDGPGADQITQMDKENGGK
jgi:hypothetical protein